VAAFGYDYWRNHWGADPNVIGRIVRINNQPVQIVGVLPYSFPRSLLGRTSEVWFPVSMRPLLMAGTPTLQQDFTRPSEALFGKLKPAVPQAAGAEELTSLTRELARQQPRYFRDDEQLEGQLVQESIVRDVRSRPAVAVFFVMILLVLLSACANLGNMLLARGLVRRRRPGIRRCCCPSAPECDWRAIHRAAHDRLADSHRRAGTDDGVRDCFRSAFGSANGPHQSAQDTPAAKLGRGSGRGELPATHRLRHPGAERHLERIRPPGI
jgi:hypothetical protein